MKRMAFVLWAMGFAAVALAGAPSDMDDVAAMRAKYDEQLKAYDVRSAAKLTQIQNQYSAELNALANKTKLRGDLDGLIAIRAEISRFTAVKTLAATNVFDQAGPLHDIQASCLKALDAVPTEKARSVLQLWERYDTALSAMEKRLTAQDHVDAALQVRKERENVRKSAEVTSAQFVLAEAASKNPTQKNPQQARPARRTAAPLCIEGFSEVVSASFTGAFITYRGSQAPSYWVGTSAGQSLQWKTAEVPKRVGSEKVLFVWAGANGFASGEFDLLLNGTRVLSLNSGQPSSKEWTSETSSLAFVSRKTGDENVGIYTLTVPASAVIPGAPQDLQVIPKGMFAGDRAWIMIHNFQDVTAAADHE